MQRFETTAVFQLESRGMKDLIKRLQPDCFEDMIALVALFRPGPLQSGMVDNFIERKHGKEAISYPDEKWQHESLKPILEPTYGIILYQEQVMQIAQTLAGIPWVARTCCAGPWARKNPKRWPSSGRASRRGGQERRRRRTGDEDLRSGGEVCGLRLQQVPLRCLCAGLLPDPLAQDPLPAEFMAAVMTADMDNTDKIVTLVDECQRMGLTVIPPDVNTGRYRFSVNEDATSSTASAR